MTVVARSVIDDAIETSGADLSVRESYQGRYGVREGFGLAGHQGAFLVFLVELAASDKQVAQILADHCQTDSLGLRTIFYFPGVSLTDEE